MTDFNAEKLKEAVELAKAVIAMRQEFEINDLQRLSLALLASQEELEIAKERVRELETKVCSGLMDATVEIVRLLEELGRVKADNTCPRCSGMRVSGVGEIEGLQSRLEEAEKKAVSLCSFANTQGFELNDLKRKLEEVTKETWALGTERDEVKATLEEAEAWKVKLCEQVNTLGFELNDTKRNLAKAVEFIKSHVINGRKEFLQSIEPKSESGR